ncbi:MAG TPA: TrmB family transcriptional regulator [Candidatus Korarchaeota archaeon]|nr:TrmB family transcriptional regulator [Candidatus Korarchaeota archaeon]
MSSNLTEYEARAYLALATHGGMTIGELSRLSDVPRAKCYETVKHLVSKGLVVTISTKPARYESLPIEEGIRNRLEQLKRENGTEVHRCWAVNQGDQVHEQE